jgi:anti-sigma factor RsiW
MNCEQRFQLLFPYSTGELAQEEMAEMKAHLEMCDTCATRVTSLRALESCVRETLHKPTHSPKLANTVMAVLAFPARQPRRGWVWAWSVAACLVVVLLARSVFVASPTRTVKPAPEHRPKERIIATDKLPEDTAPLVVPTINERNLIATYPDRRNATQGIALKAPRHQQSLHFAVVHKSQKQMALGSSEPARKLAGQSELADDALAPTEVGSRKTTMTIAFGGIVTSRVRENHLSLLPPNNDAADIERPPLKTVVKRPGFSQPGIAPESRENT